MANHKSAAKRARQSDKRSERNTSNMSKVKSAVKKFKLAATGKLPAGTKNVDLNQLFSEAQALLHKSVQKGILHRNNASRRIGRLAGMLKKK